MRSQYQHGAITGAMEDLWCGKAMCNKGCSICIFCKLIFDGFLNIERPELNIKQTGEDWILRLARFKEGSWNV